MINWTAVAITALICTALVFICIVGGGKSDDK